MVTATDPDSASDMITVTVTVTNEEETGEVTLWAGTDALTMAPQVGDTITGAVMDPDDGVMVESWQWSRTMDTADMSSWMDIPGRNQRRVHGDGRRHGLLPAGDGYVHGRGGHGHGHGVLDADHEFNPQIRLELHGATITSDAGLLNQRPPIPCCAAAFP